MTQYCLGNDNFPRKLERCCSIHATVFVKPWTKRNKTNDNNNNIDNDNKVDDDCNLLTAHISGFETMSGSERSMVLLHDKHIITKDNNSSYNVVY